MSNEDTPSLTGQARLEDRSSGEIEYLYGEFTDPQGNLIWAKAMEDDGKVLGVAHGSDYDGPPLNVNPEALTDEGEFLGIAHGDYFNSLVANPSLLATPPDKEQ